MMYYPGAFKKARDEISRVIGTDRLPTFNDRASLPYGMYVLSHALIVLTISVECVLNETWRWGVPVPLSKHNLETQPRHQPGLTSRGSD